MRFCGINKTTLLDYPGHVAATLFTGGCNMRCPFCQNSGLVLEPQSQPEIREQDILAFLQKRQGVLEGVCITGGEPTLQPDLEGFIRQVKELNYLVKLDTNGYRPQVLRHLLEEELLDYVAMDIKASREHYSLACGLPEVKIELIEQSVELLKTCRIPYEFRTTAVKGIHTAEEFTSLGQWMQGCKAYYLQNYRDSEQVIRRDFSGFDREQMEEMRRAMAEFVPQAALRGMD